MPDTVLILASGYDSATFYTRSWARRLRDDLLRRKHVCFLFDIETLCAAGHTLTHAIDCADFIVFYGHGTKDSWIAVPSGATSAAIALVDVATVSMLDGRKIYSGCCDSLGPRGTTSLSALGPAFRQQFSTSPFVGYHSKFEFEFSNHDEFRDVVNSSVVAYVSGTSAQQVSNDLATEWDNLRHAFANGRLRNASNAIMAAQLADNNRRHVGYVP